MANHDRRAYDTGASGEVQANLAGVIGRLEDVLGDRDRAVQTAMADFTSDGVADEYRAKEDRWKRSAHEVRQIIRLLKTTLERNDVTAQHTLARAKSAVDNIG
jgi:uncharacterized protein YukE